MTLGELVSYIDAEGGVVYSSQLKGAGFSARLISYMSEASLINRITCGICCTSDVFEDDFLMIGARRRRCIFRITVRCIYRQRKLGGVVVGLMEAAYR